MEQWLLDRIKTLNNFNCPVDKRGYYLIKYFDNTEKEIKTIKENFKTDFERGND